jgi:glycosyltransferase involved in cell wall biosynthesis
MLSQEDRNFFFDVSGLLLHLKNVKHFTGIQRVLVMMILRFSNLVGQDRVYLSFYDSSKKSYQAVAVSDIGLDKIGSASDLAHYFRIGGRQSRDLPPLSRYRSKPLKYLFYKFKLDLAAALGREYAFRKFSVDGKQWKKLRAASRISLKLKKPKSLSFESLSKKNDHLIVIDSSWTVGRTKEAFVKAKSSGVVVSIMIHDLIPIMVPELVPHKAPIIFHNWLLETADYTSVYLTNSIKSKVDLDLFLSEYSITKKTIAVPLAQEGLHFSDEMVPQASKVNDKAFPKLATMMEIDERVRSVVSHPYVIFVGTLETRKNIWRMALAWERLLSLHGPNIPRLVLVGRPGWFNEDFENFAAGTGNLQGWIQRLESPTDKELAFLYRHCEFGILVSLYEGWGLPIGEALSYGKTSVVGASSSLPEVGGDLVEYCDPTSVQSIVDACSKLINTPEIRRDYEERILQSKLRTWNDVAKDILLYLNEKS